VRTTIQHPNLEAAPRRGHGRRLSRSLLAEGDTTVGEAVVGDTVVGEEVEVDVCCVPSVDLQDAPCAEDAVERCTQAAFAAAESAWAAEVHGSLRRANPRRPWLQLRAEDTFQRCTLASIVQVGVCCQHPAGSEREKERERERERERVELVGSYGRWKHPCRQTAHMTK
jgi:hypothetical protein